MILGATALIMACCQGHPNVVESLIFNWNADTNMKTFTTIDRNANERRPSISKQMHSVGKTPLHFAIWNSNYLFIFFIFLFFHFLFYLRILYYLSFKLSQNNNQ